MILRKSSLPKFLETPCPKRYKKGSYVCLDFETSNRDKGDALNPDNWLVLASWIVVRKGKVVKAKSVYAQELHQTELIDDIHSVDFIIAQNAKFELQWLYRCGLDLRSVMVYDTMIAEYVINGNRKRSLDLDSIANRYGLGAKESLVSKMIKAGVCPSNIRKKWLIEYCEQDVRLCHSVFKKQMKYFTKHTPRLLPVVYTRCLLTPVLADIERNGMTLDKERVNAVRNEYVQKLAEVDEQLFEISPDVNWNSPKQKAEYLYDKLGFSEPTDYKGKVLRTPSGGRKTDTGTIAGLDARTERQRQVVHLITERNKYASALSKNLDFFYGICEDYGGRFRGVFNQCVTSTHRLSSSGKTLEFDSLNGKSAGAQFQNLPRDFKKLLCASDKDRLIGEADGSQLEFRVAGHLGRDEQVVYDIIHDVDIHAFTKDELLAAGDPELTELPEYERRQASKKSTFRPLYGGSSGSPAIQAYCKAFKEKYRQLSDVQEGWARTAASTKQLETEWGMVYYFPYAKVTKSGYIEESTKIYNFPIQAFATAEIIPIGLVYFWHRSKDLDMKIVNTIHDSIICDMGRGSVKQFAALSAQCMIDDVLTYLERVYNVVMTVPLGVGVKIGQHWTEGDESVAEDVIVGLESQDYEVINEDNVEFKCDAHRKIENKA